MSKGAKWWRAELRRMRSELMSRCRVCGSSKDVIIYDPRPLLAYPVRRTVCPQHCPDHDYDYEPGEGQRCIHCFAEPPDDWSSFDDEPLWGQSVSGKDGQGGAA